jgi:hypothetical protein
LENAKALESLKIERAEGARHFDDISPQSIVARHGARLSLVFSRNMIYLRNSRCAENWFFIRIGRWQSLSFDFS